MNDQTGINVTRRVLSSLLAGLIVLTGAFAAHSQTDPLPSWSDGPAKQAIVGFVARVTREGGPEYVEPAERVATFDNDGTLWAEQPIYFQFQFAFDRLKALSAQHPEWKDQQPFKAVLEGDEKALVATGEKGILEIMAATHAGMTTEAFASTVAQWLASARHPRFNQPYDKLVYQPQLELLGYLRANGFKTFIVSGGGVEFMRVFADRSYGIPPEQVVGSSIATKYELRAEGPALVREP